MTTSYIFKCYSDGARVFQCIQITSRYQPRKMHKSIIALFSLIALVVIIESQPLSIEKPLDQTTNTVSEEGPSGGDACNGDESKNHSRTKRCAFLKRLLFGPEPRQNNYYIGNGHHNNNNVVIYEQPRRRYSYYNWY